ncbi:MAG: tRNA 2-thiouridine(34) synthase MnmA [Coriobacteriia bacterium]|nr:tRNA 2-thiouridine(34) synthase MnmA [Coriobacteriia bacterium]
MAIVWVAMSGGVDSTVAAARLLDQGHDVTGATMRLLPEGHLASHDDCLLSAKAAAHALGIEHVLVDLSDDFEHLVLARVADAYARGTTPNPCVVCNECIKFGLLFDAAMEAGAELFATGHYARVSRDERGRPQLLRARDRTKDQTYFLYRLPEDVLLRSLFPIGESLKKDVIAEAETLDLPETERPESQDVCFAVRGNLARMVVERHPESGIEGDVVDVSDTVLGRHTGIARYTVGQRKGLGIAAETALVVVAIDARLNRLVVAPVDESDVNGLVAEDIQWRGPHDADVRCDVQIRYRSPAVPARAIAQTDRLEVTFESLQRGIAPGQAVVCYAGEICLGGGEIRARR